MTASAGSTCERPACPVCDGRLEERRPPGKRTFAYDKPVAVRSEGSWSVADVARTIPSGPHKPLLGGKLPVAKAVGALGAIAAGRRPTLMHAVYMQMFGEPPASHLVGRQEYEAVP